MADGSQTVSWSTLLVVLCVLTVTAAAPVVGEISGRLTGSPSQPLQASDATISGDMQIQRSSFGAETYHLSEIQIRLSDLSGEGVLVVQIGIPKLNRYVLTWKRNVSVSTPTDRLVRYQPLVELHPDRVTDDVYGASITVRLRSDGATTLIAERNIRMEVVG
ncbi:hypothetical protein RYH80_06980 [Halobaculum sp. MBLA0147]|uniref:hypothetical protein n=1 Tax=Halobaculum sp. MBLA0147 TaxID=3079934 RepID=UPI0035238D04